MNQLTRHIEILLLENDCVIVPDFGGFVAHWVPAHYDESDRTYLPPTRTLGFNAQLRMNDSLLVQSYVEAYDISYPEALRNIEQETAALKHQLDEEGSYTLQNLGTLTVNMEGSIEFEPLKAGLLSPDIYGLSRVSIKRLRDEAEPLQQSVKPLTAETATPATAAIAATPITTTEPTEQQQEEQGPALLDFMTDDDEDTRAISIKLSWVRNAVAVAAAVAAFFLFATPVVNSDLGSQTMSQLQSNLLYKLMPKDTNATPAKPLLTQERENIRPEQREAQPTPLQQPAKSAEAQTTELAKSAEAQTTKPAPSAEAQPTKPATTPKAAYCIVVASQVKLSNAEHFVEQLHKQGYPEAEVYIYHDIVRVICGTYATEAEAYTRLNKLTDKEEFAEAWVYKKKNV